MKKKSPYNTYISRLLLALCLAVVFNACVPHRKYAALEEQYNALMESNDSCRSELSFTKTELSDIEQKANDLYAKNAQVNAKFVEMEALYNKVKQSYEDLGENYRKLIASKSEDLARLDTELKEMESKLSQKDDDLSSREAELIKQQAKLDKLAQDVDELRVDLEAREKKVKELQAAIEKQDMAFKELTQKIKNVLLGPGMEGLTVVNKQGKIFVSVESQLLFKPGRTDIDSKGEAALLKLAEALANLNDIEIIVEGHTDSQPIKTARFSDNWDLSVLRATSVVRVLVDQGNLPPTMVIPSGRAEHMPVSLGKSAEDLSQNRRIEIIISPNLSEVLDLIQN